MSRASTPPTIPKPKAAMMYIRPSFLWSTGVNQLKKPVSARGRRTTPRAVDWSRATVDISGLPSGARSAGGGARRVRGSGRPRLLEGHEEGDDLVDLLARQRGVVRVRAIEGR